MNSDDILTAIGYMKHFIGLDYKKPSRGKYVPYRNYFNGSYDNKAWQFLLDNELIKEFKENWFELTDKGLGFLEKELGIRIMEMEE